MKVVLGKSPTKYSHSSVKSPPIRTPAILFLHARRTKSLPARTLSTASLTKQAGNTTGQVQGAMRQKLFTKKSYPITPAYEIDLALSTSGMTAHADKSTRQGAMRQNCSPKKVKQ
jgi:hypothetical protein